MNRSHLIFNSKLVQILALCVGFLVALVAWFSWSNYADAASFYVTPNSGTYSVGTTFDVSIYLDTEGQSVNAIQTKLLFPPDKLQLVSPQIGNSIIEVYTTPPRYDNAKGEVEVIGGIPNGVNLKNGLVAKLTFRVRSLGNANLRFGGDLQALLNDGRGTNALNNTNGATFKLELPPAQGPLVLSSTHPDQEVWYRNANVSLRWDDGLPPAENYSYSISDSVTDVPDDVPEGSKTLVDYRSVGDGINYFHIKALRDGRWGGVTHYTLRIDTKSPAEFKVNISPSERTFVTKPMLQFATGDPLSGFDRFEIKIIPLKIEGRPNAISENQLFTEVQSPFQTPELLYGTYDVIIRAYDKAGNTRDITQRMEITNSAFWFIGPNGVTLATGRQVAWNTLFPVLTVILLLLLILAYVVYRWYKHNHKLVVDYNHPEHVLKQLEELSHYQKKYGKLTAAFLLFAFLSVSVFSFVSTNTARAAEVAPPTIESFSKNIKDDEFFYVSGRTVEPNTELVIHLQSLVDGQSFDYSSMSDKRGDWTYRGNSFLAGGKYIVWAHAKNGQELSVPSPQVEIDVKPVAINWGGSRVTYQTIYLVAITVLFSTVILLTIVIIMGLLLARRRRRQFANTVRMAENGLKHGFIALKRDLEAELAMMQRASLNSEFAGEQNVRAEQLRQDLRNIEEIIGREATEIDRFAGLPSGTNPL